MQASKLSSVGKKIASVINNGTEAITEGVSNFNNPNDIVEALAKERLTECLKCPLFVEEPVSFFKVNDKLTPDASGMICDSCGCCIPYKIRQSKSPCDKWNK